MFTGSEKVQKAKLALLTMIRHQWEHGVAAHAFIDSGDAEVAVMLAHEAVYRQTRDGRLAGVSHTVNITDPCVCGECVMYAYRETGDAKYLRAAERMLEYINGAPANADGLQLHNTAEPMIAADCMYMTPPFYAVMGEYEEAFRQVRLRFDLLWNSEKHAMNHQYDTEKNALWRDKRWGAARGWSAAAFARMLNIIPHTPGTDDGRAMLVSLLNRVVEGVLPYQLDCGLFYDCLDDADTFVETNCAQMTAYAIYTGAAGGYLPDAHIPAADRMRAAANATMDGHGYIWGAAGAPSFDFYGISPEAQAFYILMETAAEKYRLLKNR
jgi:rhamnogalacturonyl hydrolase YesR